MQIVPACHRLKQTQAAHHCNEMMRERKSVTTGTEAPTIKATPSQQNCPMACCGDRLITNAVVAASAPIPQLVVTDKSRNLVPVTFTSAGFSSHTDRGPPSL
jgi:hypothetical protein